MTTPIKLLVLCLCLTIICTNSQGVSELRCHWDATIDRNVSATTNYTCFTPAPLDLLWSVDTRVTINDEIDPSRYYVDSMHVVYDMATQSTGLKGRNVKVATIAIGSSDDNMIQALKYLHMAGSDGCDIALLPEYFRGGNPETVSGPTVSVVAEYAARFNMYVVCPIVEEALEDGEIIHYNTAVLIGRTGKVEGIYRKVFVFYDSGLTPSRIGVQAWDLDFGRVGILICFDANFPEVWQQAAALEVDVLLWPSAYGGGMVLNAYAMLYHYYIVAAGAGWIIDITGDLIDAPQYGDSMWMTEIDLDRTFVHNDFNGGKINDMMQVYGNMFEVTAYDHANWHLFRSISPFISVRTALAEFRIETLKHYQVRSRQAVNVARKGGYPPQYEAFNYTQPEANWPAYLRKERIVPKKSAAPRAIRLAENPNPY